MNAMSTTPPKELQEEEIYEIPPDHDQRRTIGIIGGMGPYAHLDFEHKLLEAIHDLFGAINDQQFPNWLLSSIPATPDRTRALRGEGEDPLPWMLESARRITGDGRADFLVMCCHTAHAFARRLEEHLNVPLLDMVEESCAAITKRFPSVKRVGILGTTGLLRAELYQTQLAKQGIEAISLLNLPDKPERWQDVLVMQSIYGDSRHQKNDGGIKGGGHALERAKRRLQIAAKKLIEEMDAELIVAACTEIPLALTEDTVHDHPLLDPTRVLAQATIDVAYGRRFLPASKNYGDAIECR